MRAFFAVTLTLAPERPPACPSLLPCPPPAPSADPNILHYGCALEDFDFDGDGFGDGDAEDDVTPLHIAVANNQIETASALLRAGADPHTSSCKRPGEAQRA